MDVDVFYFKTADADAETCFRIQCAVDGYDRVGRKEKMVEFSVEFGHRSEGTVICEVRRFKPMALYRHDSSLVSSKHRRKAYE